MRKDRESSKRSDEIGGTCRIRSMTTEKGKVRERLAKKNAAQSTVKTMRRDVIWCDAAGFIQYLYLRVCVCVRDPRKRDGWILFDIDVLQGFSCSLGKKELDKRVWSCFWSS